MKQIVTGRSGYGKTAYITEKIKEDLKNGYENIIVIVPDQFTFETERELIKETGGGLFAIRVLSFRRLISVLRDELGTKGCFELDEVSKAMFVNKLLYDYDNELNVYKGAYRTPGFGFDMAKTVTECKQFGAEPEQLYGLELHGRTGEKLKDITTIYKAYTDFKDKFKDNEDIINIITGRIKDSVLLKGARIYIDHFDVFTYQGLCTIEEMAKVCSAIYVCLCSDGSKKGLFALTTDTMEKLRERVPDMEVVHLDKPFHKGAIGHLERNLFDGRGEIMEKADDRVELFSFSNALDEIDHAAAKIIELKNSGYNYSDISLMVGDIDEYARPVEQCLCDCGIPCFTDKKLSLMAGRIARFVIYSLRACITFDRSGYIGMIKQGIMLEEQEDIQSFENYILRYGLKRAMSPIKDDEAMEDRRKKIVISRLKNSLGRAKTVKELAEAVIAYLYSFEISFADEVEERSFKSVIDILERMQTIFGETEMDTGLFISTLETGLLSVTIGTIPDKSDCVVIGDISRTKIQRAKCLLVLGVSDGVIPKITTKSGLLNDYDTAAIGKHIKIGRDSFDLNNLEQLLTYKMLSKPTDYLYLSHSDRGVYGGEKQNRILMPKIQRLLGGKEVYCDVPFNEEMHLRLLRSKSLALKDVYANVLLGEDSYITKGAYHYFKEERGDLFTAKSFDISITDKQARQVYGSAALSASRIESYFKCAFMQFMQYGIRPKKRELYKISKLDTGSLLHSIIEEFSAYTIERTEEYRKSGKDISELYEALRHGITERGMIEDIVRKRLSEDELSVYSEDNIGRVMAGRLTALSKAALLGVVEELKNSDFVMTYSEEDLKSLGEYTLNGMELCGRIDRVDVSDRGIRIVDYKQGGSQLDYTGVYGGIKLQLLIYMSAVLEHYRKKQGRELMPLELEYYKVNTEYESVSELDKFMSAVPKGRVSAVAVGEGGRSIDGKDMERLVGFGMDRAKQAATRIYEGDIAIRPYYISDMDCACTYCDYKNVCKNADMENRRFIKKVGLEDIIGEDVE